MTTHNRAAKDVVNVQSPISRGPWEGEHLYCSLPSADTVANSCTIDALHLILYSMEEAEPLDFRRESRVSGAFLCD